MAGDRIGARSRLLDFHLTIIIIVLLVVAVLCTVAWFLSRQYGLLKDQVAGSDKRVAGFLSALVLEHERAVIGLLESCARRPLFIESSRWMDSAAVHRHLKDLKKGNAEIALTFSVMKTRVSADRLWR